MSTLRNFFPTINIESLLYSENKANLMINEHKSVYKQKQIILMKFIR